MILTIDNLDGRGAVDYSAALAADAPLKIERTLNEPSRCCGALILDTQPALAAPVRRARIVVSADGGAVLFTGYLATEPVAEYAGAGLAGPVYRITFSALSDERLLDKQRATLQTARSVTHALNFDTGGGNRTLQFASLETAMAKELTNDVTLSGQIEPTTFVTEIFSGDGTTSVFQLSAAPFRAARPTLLSDSFNRAPINSQIWNVTDPGSRISLGSGGLALSGGTGADGQTTLTAIDQVELGGTLLVEAAGVQLTTPSDGVLCGLYSGPVRRANCFAGFSVRQSGGDTTIRPLVDGTETGSSYILLDGHNYTLRMRCHAPEMQRVRQTYYARVDGVIESFGGCLVDSSASLVFEVVDLGNASNTPATVLYDGTVPSSPASCTFAAVNSLNLTGSIGACSVAQTGSVWIVSTLPGGTRQTRLAGTAGEGVDCTLSATGLVTFMNGRVPVPGETVTVLYRTRDRAVARLQDPVSVAAEAAGGVPGTTRWLGRVIRPAARSSEDCEAAAQALLALATSRAAAISGSYTAINPDDVWPGDVLAITANGAAMNVVVRTVTITDSHAQPELLTYRIAFANDWAESLGITLSEAIAPDATLPPTALTAPAQALESLSALTVVSATATALQLDAGVDPPAGGGFEVRRRDFGFGAGPGQGLVLRSPVRSFSIPPSAQTESFYVRMFSADPRIYSRHSSAVITNLPVA